MSTESSKLAFNDGWQYAPAPESTDHVSIREQYGLFIGGEFVEPAEGGYFETINPANEQCLASVALATEADVDRAVKAARKAYAGAWGKMKPADRGKYIYRIARIMQERARVFGYRVARRWQANPRIARYRHSTGRSSFLLLRRLG